MFEFLKNLFKRRGKEFERFDKIVNSYGDIINRIEEEIDKLYDQSKSAGNSKTKFTNELDNLNRQYDNKLKKELDKMIEILSRKINKTTVFSQCLNFYQHNANKKEIAKYVNLLKALREQVHIIAVRLDLSILELKDEIRTIQEISSKSSKLENYLNKIDENTVDIYNLIDRLIQELNLLK